MSWSPHDEDCAVRNFPGEPTCTCSGAKKLTETEAREYMAEYNVDPDSGMEYLHGLEVPGFDDEKRYYVHQIRRFIFR